nr:MAG TPA: DNA helix destabilizing protein [Caudoviricetes sp.]
MANQEVSTKVITGEVRFSYAHVWEPASINGGEEKYSVSILIPKSDKRTLNAINKAVEAAKQAGISKFGGKIPKDLKTPLRDGDVDREDDETYEGHYFINANCKTKPGILYKNGQPIIDSTEFYSGCYGHASVNFYAFNSNGSKGIACGLNNLMKTRDGEPLGGRSRAEDDFADLIGDDDEDDFLS